MTKLQIYSDLHLEFGAFEMPETDADIIVLAGDISVGTKQADQILALADKTILYVAGNHEFYRGHFTDTYEDIAKYFEGTHVVFMENDELISLEGVRFFGATMWTDFNLYGNSVLGKLAAQQYLNDYKIIKVPSAGYRKLLPNDTETHHYYSRMVLEEMLAEPFDGPTVVITHHAPSERSLNPNGERYFDRNSNCAYASRLDKYFPQVDLWIHGHTHYPVDYMAEGCRVISNPRGYVGHEETEGFNPSLVVEI